MKKSFFSRVSRRSTKSDKSSNRDDISTSADANKGTPENYGILLVKLVKTKYDKGLGLTVSGGVDRGSQHPIVSHLRLGGIADRSESLVVGDEIIAVNKKKTENLGHQEVVDLLRNAGQHVQLKIRYKVQKPDVGENVSSSSSKTAVIQLKKEADGFGIVVRESPETSSYGYRPLVVASVRQGSAAQSRGIIHIGDRLLAINGQALLGLSRDDALLLLKHAHDQVSLQIEYDVFHKEPINTNRSTWVVEVEKPLPTVSLGLILVEDRSGVIVISDINEGGVADRCGVFHKNDQIISINGTFIKDYSLSDVVELLGKSGSRLKIEFLSVYRLKDEEPKDIVDESRHAKVDSWVCAQGDYCSDHLSVSTAQDESSNKEPRNNDLTQLVRRELPMIPCSPSSGYDNTRSSYHGDGWPYEEIANVIGEARGHNAANGEHRRTNTPVEDLYSKVIKPRQRSNSLDPSFGPSSNGRNSPWAGSRAHAPRRSFNNSPVLGRRRIATKRNGFRRSGSLQSMRTDRLCRVEYVEVNLTADSQGFGFTIADGYVDGYNVVVIAGIECGGPAERSGVLQVNDEIVGINDTDVGMMSALQCNGILQSFGTHANILVGFTVAESIIATSGTFSVKLRKHYFGLGITYSDITRDTDDRPCIIVSHVRKGSMAYRTGMLHIGDRLVALNGRKMTCVEVAIALIDAIPMGEVVSVTIHKEEEVEDEVTGVVYTVELSKKGQTSFGIVIEGAEDSGRHGVVSSLVPGTVAERSGAVHIGDRILAVNDVLVKGKNKKEIYEVLEFSGDVAKLRLQSSASQDTERTSMQRSLDIPDLTSLHRVSAWAEIFDELDQIVATSKSQLKKPEDDGEPAQDAGDVPRDCEKQPGNNTTESTITASRSGEVKSEKGDFWENFDAFWQEHMSVSDKAGSDVIGKEDAESAASGNLTTITVQNSHDGARDAVHDDSTSGTLKGRCISVRYVVREKCDNPDTQTSREGSLERSPSIASGYETDNSTVQGSLNEVSPNGGMSRADAEPFASMDSFDISNDADDRIDLLTEKKLKSPDGLERRTFTVEKREKDGFGFSLMPDKFKQEVYIASVLPGGPSEGLLQPLDKIAKIDDHDLTQLNIYEIIQILHHGPSKIQISIVRNFVNKLTNCSA